MAREISFSLEVTAACDWNRTCRELFRGSIQPLKDMERLIQLGSHSLDPHEFRDTVLIRD